MKEYDIIIKVYNCIDEVEEEPFRQIVYAENLESAKKNGWRTNKRNTRYIRWL